LFRDEHDLEPEQPLSPVYKGSAKFRNDITTFLYCFGGLQTSYLIWGVIQEKMMSEVIIYHKFITNLINYYYVINIIIQCVKKNCILGLWNK
jgi:hypothetical protein